MLMGTAHAQNVLINPGETTQIGASSTVTQSVDSCGGLNVCEVNHDITTNTVGARTSLGGVGSKRTASVTLLNTITVLGNSDRAIDGRISGLVEWAGDLESSGFVGSAASVTVGVFVVDLDTGVTVGGKTIVNEECETNILFDSCLRRIAGSAPVNIDVSLQRGRSYELRFNLTCESNSGAGKANCIFNQNGAFPFAGGFVKRSDFTLSLEPDLIGMIEALQASVDMLKSQLATHDADVKTAVEQHDAEIKSRLDRNHETMLEAIRLLHTPQGRRNSGLPACKGAGCDFPNK